LVFAPPNCCPNFMPTYCYYLEKVPKQRTTEKKTTDSIYEERILHANVSVDGRAKLLLNMRDNAKIPCRETARRDAHLGRPFDLVRRILGESCRLGQSDGQNRRLVGAFDVLAFGGINADDFAFVDEGGHVHHDAGFKFRGLCHVGG